MPEPSSAGGKWGLGVIALGVVVVLVATPLLVYLLQQSATAPADIAVQVSKKTAP